jgi:hypothetical protein
MPHNGDEQTKTQVETSFCSQNSALPTIKGSLGDLSTEKDLRPFVEGHFGRRIKVLA